MIQYNLIEIQILELFLQHQGVKNMMIYKGKGVHVDKNYNKIGI